MPCSIFFSVYALSLRRLICLCYFQYHQYPNNPEIMSLVWMPPLSSVLEYPSSWYTQYGILTWLYLRHSVLSPLNPVLEYYSGKWYYILCNCAEQSLATLYSFPLIASLTFSHVRAASFSSVIQGKATVALYL